MKVFLLLVTFLITAGGTPARAALESVELVPTFEALSFNSPMFLSAPPDGTDRIVVVERGGTIQIFPNEHDVSASKIFLEIDEVAASTGTGEKGFSASPSTPILRPTATSSSTTRRPAARREACARRSFAIR